MAVTFTGAGTAVAASGASPQAVTTATSFAVGDYLVVLMAYDNSGGGGADPMSGTVAVSGGYTGANVSAQTGHNDPGSASAGLAARCVVFPVTTAIPTSTAINVSWSGTVVVRSVVFMKVSSNAGTVAYRTRNAATGVNGVNVTTKQQTQAANANEGVLLWAGYEYGAAVVGDTDTFVGTYSAVYGAFTGSTTSGMAAYFQSKVISANSTVTWDPTAAVASDWITGALVFTETLSPTISQTAYRFYAEGAEDTSTALASQDTAYSPNVISNLNMQLRMRLQETGAAAVPITSDFKLQYAKNGGAWADVYSDPHILTTYPFSQYTSWVKTEIRSGQSFTGNGEKLARMAFDIHKFGTPPGTYTATLFAHSGTFGTSSVGTGAALATSTTSYTSANLVTGFGWVFFDFDGTFTLVNGTNYVMAISATNAGDASNCVEIVYDSIAPTRPGNACTFNGSTWTAVGSTDYMTQVYTTPTTPPTNVVGHYSNALLGSAAESTAIVEEDGVIQRLSAGSGTFVAAGNQTGTGICEGVGWSVSNYVELLYAITLKSADLVNGDTLTFRVLHNNAVLTAYTATPTLNVTKTPPAITQAAYRFYDDTGDEATSPPLQAQDTAHTGNLGTGDGTGQFRVRLQSTTAVAVPATDDFALQWEKNASGIWHNVNGSTLVEEVTDNPAWADLGLTSSNITSLGQSFTGNGEKLSRVGWEINKGGAPAGTLNVRLYAHTGTYGSTGIPTGAALATSTTSLASAAITGGGSNWYYFDFDGTFTLVSGTQYFIALYYTGSFSASDWFSVSSDDTSPAHPGNRATLVSSTWTALSTQDMVFRLYTKSASVIGYDSPTLTEAGATTSRLTGGTGSFVAGKVAEDGLVDNLGWGGNNFTELVFSVKLVAAQLANGDTVKFRVIKNGSTTDMTYSVVPTINIVQVFAYNETGRLVAITATATSTDQADFKEAPADAVAYLTPTVGFAHTPDPAVMPDTGCVWVFKVRGPQAISNPWNICSQNPTDGNVSWRLNRHGNDGSLAGAAYPAGTYASGLFFAATNVVTIDRANPECLSLAYTRTSQAWVAKRSSDGGVTFPTTVDSGFGTSFAGWFNSTGRMVIGGDSDGASSVWDDRIYWVELRTGTDPVGGTLLWRFDASEWGSGTSWVDARGKTWTLTNAAAITAQAMTMMVQAAATVTCTDTIPTRYNEAGLPVVIASTVTTTDLLHLNEQVHTNYLIPFVGHVTTPDSGPLPASCVWVMKLRPHHIMSGDQTFGGQWDTGTVSWSLYMQNGNFFAALSLDGTTTHMNSFVGSVSTSTVPNGVDVFLAMRIQADYDGANGRVTTFRSTDGTNWTQIGVGSPTKWTVLHDSTGPIRMGTRRIGYPSWNGRMYSSEMRTGIDPNAGTVLWRFDSNEYAGAGTSYVDPRGQTWTLTTAGAIFAPPPTAAAAATVTSTDALKHAYNETGLTTTIVSAVTTTDQTDYDQLALPVTVVSTTTTTDQVDFKQLDLPVTVVSTTTLPVDRAKRPEQNLATAVVATVGTPTDKASYKGLALATTAVATTTLPVDQTDLHEAVALVSIISTVTPTDTFIPGSQNYNETGRAVVIVSATTSTDQVDHKELDRPVAAAATTTPTDLLKRGERDRPVAIVSTVTPTDVLKRGERDRPVTIVATTTVTDLRHVGERDRPVVVISTINRTDIIHYGERDRAVAVVSAMALAVDQADFKELGATVTTQAVRFSEVTKYYSRSAAGLGNSPITMACWVYLSVDTDNYAGFLSAFGGTTNYIAMETDGDGTTLDLYASFGGANGGVTGPSVDMSIGQWYYTAFVFDPSGTDMMYYATAVDPTLTTVTIDFASQAGVTEPATFNIGMDGWAGDWLNGRIAQVKVWNAALTQAELETEKPLDSVARTANLWAYYSFRNGPQTNDESGNGRTLTTDGTLTAEAGSLPVVDGLPISIVSTVTSTDSAVAGAIHYDETGRLLLTSSTVTSTERADYNQALVISGTSRLNSALGSVSTPNPGLPPSPAFTIVAKVINNTGLIDLTLVGQASAAWAGNGDWWDNLGTTWPFSYFAGLIVDPGWGGYTSAWMQLGDPNYGGDNNQGEDESTNTMIQATYWAIGTTLSPRYDVWGYYSNDGTNWTGVEIPHVDSTYPAVTMWAMTTPLWVGANSSDSGQDPTGLIEWVELRAGLGPQAGAVQWRMDLAEYAGGTSWVDARGRSWTLTSVAALVPGPVTATIRTTDQADFKEPVQTIAAVSSVATVDLAKLRNTALLTSVVSNVALAEQFGYGAFDLPVVVASTVTTTDQADYDQLTLPVAVVSTVTTTDLLKRGERLLPVAVISATTTTDQADFEDPARSVVIVSGITVTDNQMSPGYFDETNRPISLLATMALPTDQTDYDLLALPVATVATVTTPVDQTDYDQLALPVAAAATTSRTDLLKRGEANRPVAVVATVSSTDIVHWRGAALSVTASSTVASTDLLKRGELTRGVAVVSTLTTIDSLRRVEPALLVVAAATIATTDQADFKQLTLPVVITSAITSLDIVIGGPVHYNETGKQINIVSAVAATDRADFNQTLTVSAVAATSCTELRKHGEKNLSVTAASQVMTTDQADLHDLVAVSIVSSTALDQQVVMRDLIQSIDIASTVTSTERVDLNEIAMLNLAVLFGAADQANHTQMLDLFLVSQFLLQDVLHGVATVLNDALAIYLGDQPVSRVYVGDTQVWEEN